MAEDLGPSLSSVLRPSLLIKESVCATVGFLVWFNNTDATTE